MSYSESRSLMTECASLTLLVVLALRGYFFPESWRSSALFLLAGATVLVYCSRQLRLQLAKRACALALQAERTGAERSRFLARVGHQIRTPMHQILGSCHLLQQTRLAPEQEHYLNSIKCCAASLILVSDEALDQSRRGTATLEIDRPDFWHYKGAGTLQAPPQPEPFPEALPGPAAHLDMEEGIRQIGGSRELYLSLLLRFADEYGATPDALESEIGKGNLSGAALLAQAVKGIAGVLAAQPLQRAAAELERTLQQGGLRVGVALAGFRHELESVLSALPEEIRHDSPGMP
jgi:HPt (histidine-containing phosphotransfer) domain-containing protein